MMEMTALCLLAAVLGVGVLILLLFLHFREALARTQQQQEQLLSEIRDLKRTLGKITPPSPPPASSASS